jgi:hypothetical protein
MEDERRTTDAKWWQKLTLPLARWAKNVKFVMIIDLQFGFNQGLQLLRKVFIHFSMGSYVILMSCSGNHLASQMFNCHKKKFQGFLKPNSVSQKIRIIWKKYIFQKIYFKQSIMLVYISVQSSSKCKKFKHRNKYIFLVKVNITAGKGHQCTVLFMEFVVSWVLLLFCIYFCLYNVLWLFFLSWSSHFIG